MIRRTYIRKVEARLERLVGDIEHLRKRIATPAGEIRDRIDLEIRDLGSKAEAVRDRVRAVEAAGESSWGLLKSAVDEGLKQLGQGIDEALEKVRKTGFGGR